MYGVCNARIIMIINNSSWCGCLPFWRRRVGIDYLNIFDHCEVLMFVKSSALPLMFSSSLIKSSFLLSIQRSLRLCFSFHRTMHVNVWHKYSYTPLNGVCMCVCRVYLWHMHAAFVCYIYEHGAACTKAIILPVIASSAEERLNCRLRLV